MNIERLRIFGAVMEHQGFSAAARRLDVTKSHASQVVASLEAELGVRLLQRTTRRVTPTREGTLLYERIAPHLAALVDAPRSLERGRQGIAGELRLSTTAELGEQFVAPVVARFCIDHPEVRITVRITPRIVDLVGERFDFAIRAGKIRERGLVARPLAEIEFGLYASPQYLLMRQGEGLAQDTFISVRPEEVSTARIRKFVGPTRTRVEVDDFAFARSVANAGGGVALLPSFLVEKEVSAGALRRVLPTRRVRFPVCLVYPSARQMPLRAMAFRDALLGARGSLGAGLGHFHSGT